MQRSMTALTLFACVVITGPDGATAAIDAGRSEALSPSPGDLFEFLVERGRRRWTRVPRKVLAFYYTWYGRPERHGRWVHWGRVEPEKHEISASTHYPARGAYDSHDPATIDYHIECAKGGGVDGFICTWWGQGGFDDRAFVTVLERAKEKDFTVTVYWETVPGSGRAKLRRAVDDLLYLLRRYASHPAFLKVDGKPVIFVYGRVMGQITMAEWQTIIRAARERYGRDFLLIADGYTQPNARLFDGVHTYNICGWVQRKSAEALGKLSAAAFGRSVRLAREHGKISCITVIPGYDDTKIRTPGINAARLDGATYRVLWEAAIAADPDWVLITSWNEWHEGSEIEPSFEDGDRYIKLTGPYAKRFKRTPYSRVAIPERSGGVAPDTARELRRLYGDRTVAIMPDFSGEAVFWLADTGVRVKALSWEDVVTEATFNAAAVPVAVYAGYESYRQSVRAPGDVDRAIVRYLSEGGLLMVLPSGPFPFFYNEARRAVASTHTFGFSILGGASGGATTVTGWEHPPAGVKLTFEFDTSFLKGVPERAPFPAAGDVRWRPCVREGLAEADVYRPLARLTDQTGRWYGDAVVYVEHVASPPRKAKVIYAWMRMIDVAGKDELLCGLFRLAAEKMVH